MKNLQQYNKAIVAVIGGLVTALELYFDVLPSWAQLLVTVLTAAGVYQVPNKK